MPIKTLDALVLATLPEDALIPRLAALWLREFNNQWPHSKQELMKWVKRDFGPVIDAKRRDHIAIRLLEECKRQLRIRRRREDHGLQDPLSTPPGSDLRMGALLSSRLGPARRHAGSADPHASYISGAVYSGLVAGLIPVTMKLRRIENPNLLVYRQNWEPVRTYFVPGHILTVADAFIWLIPPDVAEFLELDGTRIEHDGEAQAVRLITPFGTKTLPWRSL
jgi:hypothetical protein